MFVYLFLSHLFAFLYFRIAGYLKAAEIKATDCFHVLIIQTSSFLTSKINLAVTLHFDTFSDIEGKSIGEAHQYSIFNKSIYINHTQPFLISMLRETEPSSAKNENEGTIQRLKGKHCRIRLIGSMLCTF